MADYLLTESNFSITEYRDIFTIRGRVNPRPANRGLLEYSQTQCREMINNPHIFTESAPLGQQNFDPAHNFFWISSNFFWDHKKSYHMC